VQAGTRLGAYRIDREIGSGGMGRVFAAVVEGRCPGLVEGTRVALKVVHPHLLETEGFFKRFLREGEIGKTVRHENVVATYDCDSLVSGGNRADFLSMEYVEGQTLRELMAELDRVPEELCRHIGREVCKGLGAIHAAGVIHRDMKPDNVLITADHVVKVMDLGVARLQDEQLRLSQTGAFVGSIHYAAPECFSRTGAVVDGRADLHALGLVLYELSCGTNPYVADRVPQILDKVLNEVPRRLGDVDPQLSPFFEEVVHTLLAKDPDARFPSADELLTVLEDGEDGDWWKGRARSIQATTQRPIRRIRIPRETAVYGREPELAKLRALHDAAKSGDGRVVVLEGEAGIGKSRLIDELVARLQADGEDVNLNFLFGSYPPNGAASAAGAFSAAFREQFGAYGSAPYLTATPLLVPAFDAVLSGDAAPGGVEPLTRDSLATCFVNATRALAAERPTIVLIDDLHFAPEEARALFTSLAMAAPGHRVLLIGTTRPGVSEDWQGGLDRFEHVSRLAPQRLVAKDVAALLEDAFHSQALAESLGMKILLKSDGNPFFLFEMIRGLREGLFITQKDDGTWVSTRVIDEIQIPSSVLDLVSARVAGLTEDERASLDVAACWGYEFDPALVGEVLGLARIPALRSFGQVERMHRLVRSSGRSYVFDHHQVQEALYASLNEQLREEYHAALAAALESRTKAAETDPGSLDGDLCVNLCEHYLKGARGKEALRYLEDAGRHLTTGYLHAQMVDLTERALAVPGLLAGGERARALLRLASALDSLSRRQRQEECVREAERLAEAADDDELRVRTASELGRVFQNTARYAEAEPPLRRAIELAVALGDREGEADATVRLGSVFQRQGRLPETREHVERALAIGREIGSERIEADAMTSLGMVFAVEHRIPEAHELYARALDLNRSLGSRTREAIVTMNVGSLLTGERRLPEAREHFERALALGREVGHRELEARVVGNLAGVFQFEDRVAEARELVERQIALVREIGDRQQEAVALGNLGLIARRLGDRDCASASLTASLAISRQIGAPFVECFGLWGLAHATDEQGHFEEALRLLDESLALRRSAGYAGGVADSLTSIADLRLREADGAPDHEAVRTAAVEVLSLSREQGRQASVAHALALLACLPGGDTQAAIDARAGAGEDGNSARGWWLLWQATGDRAHLAKARRLLDELLAKVPEEHHQAMRTNVRLNRDILAACTEQGL